MKPIYGLIIFIVLLGGIIAVVIMSGNDSASDQQNETETTGEMTESTSYTLAEVAEHSSASDCWTIVLSKVYDISSYVPRHPGGDEILLACGGDGTTLFVTRRTVDDEIIGSGRPHSANAEDLLSDLYIGELAN